jgi:hypothetical protein
MTKISDIENIITGHLNRDKTPEEATSDLGATILEMSREERYYGKHTRRMATLKKIAVLQEKVVHRMLDKSLEKHDQPKRPHLTVVK